MGDCGGGGETKNVEGGEAMLYEAWKCYMKRAWSSHSWFKYTYKSYFTEKLTIQV